MTEERPKTPSKMKVEEWKANKLYEMALKDHAWEKYLKSIGKENIGVKSNEIH